MKIKRAPLVFHNVLGIKVNCNVNEWVNYARELRNSIIKNDLYGIGPVIYTINNFDKGNNKADICIYIPINAEINLEENDTYIFMKELKFEDGLSLRHADLDEDLEETTYDMLKEAAKAYELNLIEPFYNIYLDVFGGGIIDVYAPIKSNI